MRRDVQGILELVKGGADPNVKTADGWSAFEVALSEGDWEAALTLASNASSRADVNAPFHDGTTALEQVALAEQWDRVYALIAMDVDLDTKFQNGPFQSVLQLACLTDSWEAVQFIINAKVGASAVSHSDAVYALRGASHAGRWDLVRSLIADAKLDVNTVFHARGRENNNILEATCQCCDMSICCEVVEFLLEAGADPNSKMALESGEGEPVDWSRSSPRSL
ncbi:hypothetical protein NMY22_g4602 [Coprinellus aureogranulatus]|nr:hypothetical protein NMY22_g4602 [Coprinellus aureogranulatus]